MVTRRRRLVLYPQGEPIDDVSRRRCAELVHWCGGDPFRVIGTYHATIAQFAKHASRVAALRDDPDKPLVVFTETIPARGIVEERILLESLAPTLKGAPCIVYVDDADPYFADAANALGELASDIASAPVWTLPGPMHFLVVSPDVVAADLLWPRVEALALASRPPPMSAIQRRADAPSEGDAATQPRRCWHGRH